MVAPFIPPKHSLTRPAAHIRILATTDLHGHLLPYDYIKDQPTQGGGLAGLARLITEARAQAKAVGVPVVLLDNGDTFQGTSLASHLVGQQVGSDHPIVAALNYLEYDAIGLGNHDLDHGLAYLKAVAGALNMPILNSNLRGNNISPLRQSLLLPVDLGPEAAAPLTLGILSVLPEQSVAWQSHHLSAQTTLDPPCSAVRSGALALREAGADLIVVLAHLGVGFADSAPQSVQAAHAVVASGQVDALILGHTHRRLPSADYATRGGVDLNSSTIGGVPTVMAGHAGSDLGVIDLALGHDGARGWYVAGHHCSLMPNGANVMPSPTIAKFAKDQHEKVTSDLAMPVATTARDLHSYFSLVAPSDTQRLIARAQHLLVREALPQSTATDLPILSASAAHAAGGRDGPGNYILIPQGTVLKRHIAGLNPFENETVGIRITGASLLGWLEHAALLFNTLRVTSSEQMLINPDVPAFQSDAIFGLEAEIDPTAPPQERIVQMLYNKAPVDPEQEFILATSQFRVAGGGGYPPIPQAHVVTRSRAPLRDAVIRTLNDLQSAAYEDTGPWRFKSSIPVEAVFLTHPDALPRLGEISHLAPRLRGTTPNGFIRLSIKL